MVVVLLTLAGMALALAVIVLVPVVSKELLSAPLSSIGGPVEMFACKSRLCWHTRWPRRRARAMWVHGVLIVQVGRVRPRTTALAVRLPEDVTREAREDEISGLGPHPVVITLRLDDDLLIDVASSEQDRSLLVGPFWAAAIPGLRSGQVERIPPRPGQRQDHPSPRFHRKERD